MKTEKLLSGVKVIELATFVAAPSCTKALGEWGADVLKIEAPSLDPFRFAGGDNKMPIEEDENPGFDLENSNKRGIILNLKSKKGMEIFNKLLSTADVFVTNLRTAALEKLGISYEQLSKKYPGIVFGQILGYGEEGPAKDRQGFDFTAFVARGGILGTMYEKGTVAMNAVPGFGDHQCGMYLAGGICAALYKKQLSGRGEKVTVSLYNAALYTMGIMITSSQYGNAYPIKKKQIINPLLNNYMTSDERCLQMALPEYNKYIAKFLNVIGLPELAVDEKFSSFQNLNGNSEELTHAIQAQIAKKPVAEWLSLFEEVDLACEKAYLWHEVLEDEQAWANNYLRKVEYRTGNVRTLVNSPVKFKNMGMPEFKLGPKIGEHTEEILLSLGYTAEEITQMDENKEIKKR